ncbi:HAF repeat-containing protein [Anaeromyxobacter sp. Fw109-5]|uniref:HAF repeat-containing protein n=1 Tax=Anaeromyxobacter sp. (strain Fw109-5) TaxID=404589 RepID=UPI0013051D40|nr:HAF repeat-containing protein [Anaeromyxobacter sp. Fw109-5]
MVAVGASVSLATSALGQTVPVIIDLGTLGGTESYTSAPPQALTATGRVLTETGQVVGTSTLADGSLHAFSWTQAGGMVDLGTLGGGRSEASAASDGGQVVGASALADGSSHAFSWTQAGGMVDLGTLGGTNSHASAVNESGQVVGESWMPPDDLYAHSHAFLWTQEDGMTDLGALRNPESLNVKDSAGATAINDAGQVIGISGWYTEYHVFFWDSGNMIDLIPQYGGYSGASSVNESGQVVGWTWWGHWTSRPFSWTRESGFIDLGTLPGGWLSEASAVNDSGQVVGWSMTGPGYPDTGPRHAFSWTQDGGMIDLGTLAGMESSEARAVNDRGQVVGTGTSSDGSVRAFSWTQAGGMIDLGALGGGRSEAFAINESGQIAGESQLADGSWHAVLWKTDPVAEIELLVQTIDRMALPFGTQTSLERKLAAANAALAAGDIPAACEVLASFRDSVSAQSEKRITRDQSQDLVAFAADVHDMLQCP